MREVIYNGDFLKIIGSPYAQNILCANNLSRPCTKCCARYSEIKGIDDKRYACCDNHLIGQIITEN